MARLVWLLALVGLTATSVLCQERCRTVDLVSGDTRAIVIWSGDRRMYESSPDSSHDSSHDSRHDSRHDFGHGSGRDYERGSGHAPGPEPRPEPRHGSRRPIRDRCWDITIDYGTVDFELRWLNTGSPDSDEEIHNVGLTLYDGDSMSSPVLAELSATEGNITVWTYTSTGRHMFVHWNGGNHSLDYDYNGFAACLCHSETECMCDEGLVICDFPPAHRRRWPMIVGVVLVVLAIIGIIVGAVVTHRCRHRLLTPYHQRNNCGGLDKGATVDEKMVIGPVGGRPWITPATPPAYTAFSLPPPYITGGPADMPVTAVHGLAAENKDDSLKRTTDGATADPADVKLSTNGPLFSIA